MSIKLTTGDRIAETSSKGNQEKWREKGRWYKLDLFGYEGLAETVISTLLGQTNVEALGFRYVPYRMERLEVHRRVRNGCSRPHFFRPRESILTLSDLFCQGVGPDRHAAAAPHPHLFGQVRWGGEQNGRLTGLQRFGAYLTLLFEADVLFGNEDRHLNNIAVLRRGNGFDYCPLFDFGAGLLSNIRDYPLDIDPKAHVRLLRARPLDTTFTRQVHAAQSLYGPQLAWHFTSADLANTLAEPLTFYAQRDAASIAERAAVGVEMQQKKMKK